MGRIFWFGNWFAVQGEFGFLWFFYRFSLQVKFRASFRLFTLIRQNWFGAWLRCSNFLWWARTIYRFFFNWLGKRFLGFDLFGKLHSILRWSVSRFRWFISADFWSCRKIISRGLRVIFRMFLFRFCWVYYW